ncbi:hypothetical protein ACOMHN_063321 [Nucella lapillus]
MIRNVRLGHGLFDLIRQERTTKKTAALMEKQRKLEAARNMWQPPKRDSESEEESDDDIIQDDGGRYSSGEACHGSSASGKKKKSPVPRPYTPQHTSLCEIGEQSEESSQHALFRQLCVLNWILDAMNMEQGYTMSPIMTCWSHNEIGGSRMTTRKAQQERQAEMRWERFLSTPMPGKMGKKSSAMRPSRHHLRQSLRHFNPRTSLQSPSPSPSSSSSAVNVSNLAVGASLMMATAPVSGGVGGGGGVCPHREETIPEEGKLSPLVVPPAAAAEAEDEVDPAYSKSMFKFLDEYYDSLRREKNNEDEANQGADNSAGATPSTPSANDKSKRALHGVDVVCMGTLNPQSPPAPP